MVTEVRIRRMLAVCAAGRILNPKTARSQVIGSMTMGVGAALMEELAVDKRHGFDIPHQEVLFFDETDPNSSPMKAKGVGELGICGVSAAVANAIYNATGVRVRDYPITLDKLLEQLPDVGERTGIELATLAPSRSRPRWLRLSARAFVWPSSAGPAPLSPSRPSILWPFPFQTTSLWRPCSLSPPP